jgi:hypothetical protein
MITPRHHMGCDTVGERQNIAWKLICDAGIRDIARDAPSAKNGP